MPAGHHLLLTNPAVQAIVRAERDQHLAVQLAHYRLTIALSIAMLLKELWFKLPRWRV